MCQFGMAKVNAIDPFLILQNVARQEASWSGPAVPTGGFTMRDLETSELSFVYGAGCSPIPPVPAKKGNNGFGNGSDTPNLAAPGGSGDSPGEKDLSQFR